VHHWLVAMRMRMGHRIRHRRVSHGVDVLMMLVVYVRVDMVDHLVAVLVLVSLGEV